MQLFSRNSSTSFQVSSGGDTTFIASDCHINGTVTIQGNARIDGQVEGTIKISGDLIVGTNAKIKADIEASNVQVAGEVQGNIISTNSLELSSTAKLTGDIRTQQLKIEQGARFIGNSRLLDDEKNSNEKIRHLENSSSEPSAATERNAERNTAEKRRGRA